MRILKMIGWILLALIGVLLILGMVLPKEWTVEREVLIDAPKPLVFNLTNSLRDMQTWSPWAELDPDQVTTWEGEDGAPGSSMTWDGNSDVGKGIQTLTAVEDNTRVDSRLEFIEPYADVAEASVMLEDADESTRVKWRLSGKSPFPRNVISLIMGMKGSLENSFDKGLAKLKTMAEEKAANPVYRGYAIQRSDAPARVYMGYRARVSFADMSAWFQKNMPAIFNAAMKAGAALDGPPAGLFYEWDMEGQMADLATAVPVKEVKNAPGVAVEQLPAGPVVTIDYYGPYEGSGEAHFAMDDYMKDFGLTAGSPVIEEYITDPTTEPDTAKWLTRIVYYIQN